MYVQDLKSPGVNITAEISKEEAYNFKKMCKMFSAVSSYQKSIDEYVSKLSEVSTLSSGNADSTENPVNGLTYILSLQTAIASLENRSPGALSSVSMNASSSSITNDNTNVSNGAGSRPTIAQRLEDFIIVKHVFYMVKLEMDQITSREKGRKNTEKEIVKTLSSYFEARYSGAKIARFGSITYGFGGPGTNLNIMVITGKISTNCSFFVLSLKILEFHRLIWNTTKFGTIRI